MKGELSIAPSYNTSTSALAAIASFARPRPLRSPSSLFRRSASAPTRSIAPAALAYIALHFIIDIRPNQLPHKFRNINILVSPKIRRFRSSWVAIDVDVDAGTMARGLKNCQTAQRMSSLYVCMSNSVSNSECKQMNKRKAMKNAGRNEQCDCGGVAEGCRRKGH